MDLNSFEVVINPKTVSSGWFHVAPGEAPREVLDGDDGPAPDPSGLIDYKRGFKLELYGAESLPGLGGDTLGHRVFSSTAIGPIRAIEELYRTIMARRDEHPGLCPVVRFDGSTPIALRMGTSYRPNTRIVDWAKWPFDPVEYKDASPPEGDDDLDF